MILESDLLVKTNNVGCKQCLKELPLSRKLGQMICVKARRTSLMGWMG